MLVHKYGRGGDRSPFTARVRELTPHATGATAFWRRFSTSWSTSQGVNAAVKPLQLPRDKERQRRLVEGRGRECLSPQRRLWIRSTNRLLKNDDLAISGYTCVDCSSHSRCLQCEQRRFLVLKAGLYYCTFRTTSLIAEKWQNGFEEGLRTKSMSVIWRFHSGWHAKNAGIQWACLGRSMTE